MAEWAKSIGLLLGGTVAGPFGALIGGILGGVIDSVTPGAADITANVLAGFGTDGLKQLSQYGYERFRSPQAIKVNHDLQNAFRDGLRTAIYDIGGQECFPQEWSQARRVVPIEVVYPLAALRHRDTVLADQICTCLREFSLAVDSLLPLTAPPADSTAINPYLIAEPTTALERDFWQNVVQPFLASHPVAPEVSVEFEAHLRRYLLPRTLVHLSENLKQRPETWRAFNRLMLESIQQTLTVVAANGSEVRQELSTIQAQLANLAMPNGAPNLLPDSEQLATLIGEVGETRRLQDERFDDLVARVVRQHSELLDEFRTMYEAILEAVNRLSQSLLALQAIQVSSAEIQELPPFPGEAPYKGLLAYEAADEAIYFGRHEIAAHLAQSVRGRSLVAVVGGSGSGKSSLVGAGLLPILERQGWRVLTMTPTAQPLDKLARTLYPHNEAERQKFRQDVSKDAGSLAQACAPLTADKSGQHTLLVVDQFEELFTQAQDEAAKRAFVATLLAAPSNPALLVVIVLRSDFYHRCSEYEGLFSAVAESQIALEPLNHRQLVDVIKQPLLRNHWRIQEGLTETIIADVGGESGGLPFLAHALRETWERRRHNILTLSGYQEAGGVKGAITASAEAAWLSFNPQEQVAARAILTDLTELGERQGEQLLTPDTRRRRTYAALALLPIAPATLERVLEELVHRRLLIRDQENIEVAHEALIRAWPRLQQWLSTDHALLRVKRQIEAEAEAWESHQREASYLARGSRLALASEWAAGQPRFPSGVVGEFLQASLAAQEAERSRELQQAQTLAAAQSRRLRTLRWAAIITSVLAVLAIIAAAWAVDRQSAALESAKAASTSAAQAQGESTRAAQAAESANSARATADANAAQARVAQAQAEAAARTAQSRALAAAAQSEASSNPMRSWLLAIEAGQRADTEEAFSAINALAAEMAQPQATLVHTDSVTGALWNGDGSRILTWSGDAARVWDAKSGDLLFSLAHDNAVFGAAWNRDESRILTWSADNSARVWDAKSGSALFSLNHDDHVYGAAWNEDGSRILSWSFDGAVRVWDAKTGKRLLILTAGAAINEAAWDKDESRILAWGWDNLVRVWDAQDGDPLFTLTHVDGVNGDRWNRDGSLILSWGNDNMARVWSASDGKSLLTLRHPAAVHGALWDGEEKHILTWADDNNLRVWDAKSGKPLLTLSHENAVLGARWNQDGSRILSWSWDDSARVWDAKDGTLLLTLPHNDDVHGALWNKDESRILSWGKDNNARLWDANSGVLLLTLAHDGDVYGAAWNGDESRILTRSDDGAVHVWEAKSGGAILPTLTQESAVRNASWSHDQSSIVAWGDDYNARVWDTQSGDLLFTLKHQHLVQGAAWNPGTARNQADSRLLTWSVDGDARIWDAASGAPLITFTHTGGVYGAQWNGDESRILTWTDNGYVSVWDAVQGTLLLSLKHDGVKGERWNQDGSRILSWSLDGSIRLWDGANGALLHSFDQNETIQGATWNKDGTQILSWGDDDSVRVWDVDGGEQLLKFTHNDDVYGAAWNQNESRILSWSTDGSVRVWDVTGNTPPLILRHDDLVDGAAWSRDGSQILSWSWDKAIRLWDAEKGALLLTLNHDGFVYGAEWNADESRILSWGEDKSARLWDASNGDRLQTISSDAIAGSVHWSPDESQIMLATLDGHVYRYHTHMSALINAACRRATRNLTWSEWQQFLPGEAYHKSCPDLPVHASVPKTALAPAS